MKATARYLDLAALVAVLAVAVAVRLAFLSVEPPVFLTTDSLTYALPASHLADGQGFDLSLRRTPGYPLVLAATWALFGDDLRPVAYAQHLFGVATAGVTWLLGRLAIGRVAGLLGGLAVALSGPQVVYEHYLMTEALFTLLLVLGTLALTLGLRSGAGRHYLLAGGLFGLCALTRPVGQIFPLLVPIAVLLAGGRRDGSPSPSPSLWERRAGVEKPPRPPGEGIRFRLPWRYALRATLLAALGFGLVVLPWTVRNSVVGGELTGSSALGKTLFGRITRHDDGFRFDLPPAGAPERDPRRAEARALAREAAQRDTSRGSLVHERLMREYGYTEAQAYNVMRDVALEIILAQPDYYVRSSLSGVTELFLAEPESFRSHVERLANERVRDDWGARPELASLLPPAVRPEDRWRRLGRANAAVQLYRPWDPWLGPIVGALFLVGAAAIALRARWRAALPLPLIAGAVLVLSAFLDGPVPRFRYPLDPLITLTAGAGLVAFVRPPRRAVRPGPPRREPELETVATTTMVEPVGAAGR